MTSQATNATRRRPRSTRVPALTAVVLLAVVGCTTDLGTLGGASSRALDINDAGVVVGQAQVASGDRHAFVRTGGGPLTALALLPEHTESTANAVNALGIIVGSSGPNAVLWDQSRAIGNMGNLGGKAQASDINVHNVIVGSTETNPTGGPAFAFAWSGALGRMTALTNPAGATASAAHAINDAGIIVGSATIGGRTHAVKWSSPTAVGVDLTPTGGPSVAYAINAGGTIVGQATFGTDPVATHAARWPAGSTVPVNLGALGAGTSQANDINRDGVVVGVSDTDGGHHQAVRWAAADIAPTALSHLSGGRDSMATAINGTNLPIGEAATQAGVTRAAQYDQIPSGGGAVIDRTTWTASIGDWPMPGCGVGRLKGEAWVPMTAP